MPTIRTVYLDGAATGAADGTSFADAYTSIADFDAGEAGNITAAGSDEIVQANVRSPTTAVLSGALDAAGWVCDSTHYIEFIGDWVGPTRDSTQARIEGTTNGFQIVNVDYVKVRTIQVENTEASPSGTEAALASDNGGGVVEIHDSLLLGGRQCLRAQDGTTKVTNTIIISKPGSGGAGVFCSTGDVEIYSSVLVGASFGFRAFSGVGTHILKNCYCKPGITNNDGSSITIVTTATTDTSGEPASLDSIAYNTTQFVNVTDGSEDFEIPSGSALIDVGTNTSGDAAPFDFSDDILGVARGATWDVGVWELVAAPSAAIMNQLQYSNLGSDLFNGTLQ